VQADGLGVEANRLVVILGIDAHVVEAQARRRTLLGRARLHQEDPSDHSRGEQAETADQTAHTILLGAAFSYHDRAP
jgi:hypothetical protein